MLASYIKRSRIADVKLELTVDMTKQMSDGNYVYIVNC